MQNNPDLRKKANAKDVFMDLKKLDHIKMKKNDVKSVLLIIKNVTFV